MNGYDYSWVTEGIVVATWALPPWYAFIMMRESGRSRKAAWTLFAVLAGWAIFAWMRIRGNMFAGEGVLGEITPVIILGLGILLTVLFAKRIIGDGLSQHWLIGLQVFRVIGLVFILEWSRGNLPGIFAHPAGWGDLAAGLVALTVLMIYRNREIPAGAIYLVAGVGIADAISAMFFGFLSSPTELQLFAFDRPNQVIAYPTGLIPMFLIVLAVLFHVLSLAELHRSKKALRKI